MKKNLKKIASALHINVTGVEPPSGFLSTFATLLSLLSVGTVFYHTEEGWSYFDSFYFTVVTITTVGYGDFHPSTTLSKTFTMFLIFMGVGLGLYVITSFSDSFRTGREKRLKRFESIFGKNFRQE